MRNEANLREAEELYRSNEVWLRIWGILPSVDKLLKKIRMKFPEEQGKEPGLISPRSKEN